MELEINSNAWQMLRVAVLHDRTQEVAGFGRIEVRDNIIIVDDILIPPQEIGGAHAEMERKDLDWLLVQLAQRGEHAKDWSLWWHSHASMSTSPSSTDHSTLKDLARQSSEGYALGLVVNANGDATAWAAVRSSLSNVFVEETLHVVYEEHIDEELRDYVKGMMEHVTKSAGKWFNNDNAKGNGAARATKQSDDTSKELPSYASKSVYEMSDDEYEAWMDDLEVQTLGTSL